MTETIARTGRCWRGGLLRGVGRQALCNFAGALAVAGFAAPVLAASVPERTVLPIPAAAFQGVQGLQPKDSTPSFPRAVEAPAEAPNVLLILMDDIGFGETSTFGGPVPTPNLQRLADQGLRFNRFHTTAVCSPTRAAFITGRNHHSAHTGAVTEMATGYPGYDTMIGPDTATIGQTLKLNGYNTAWFGKNHNVGDWESSQAGPFDRWPTGLGFEKFYGFIGGVANNWRPALFDGTTPIEPYLGNPNYNLDFDLADQAIAWVQTQKTMAPDKPFFMYYATAAGHAPQQATPEWIARFKGQFDQGWDKVREETFARQKAMGIIPSDARLTPRPAAMPSWDSASPREKKVYAAMMELAAAHVAQADYNIGRVLSAIDDMGQTDNTLVIFVVGDNGASGEGSLRGAFNDMNIVAQSQESLDYVESRLPDFGTWKSSNLYPVPWGWAMNTPFQWTKQVASHFGGTRNGMVVSWPKGIKARGEIRTQFHHVIDVVPTVLEAANLPQPVRVNGVDQRPIEGTSMLYAFADPKAPGRRTTQYFEIFGNSGIYHDGWFASTTPTRLPWSGVGNDMNVLTTKWELYNIDKDFSQANDLAAKNPEKLREMQTRFYVEAARYNVLPIQTSAAERFGEGIRPSLTGDRKRFTYMAGMTRIPEGAAPNIKNRSWGLSTEVEVIGNDNGVIATQGGLFGGWGLYFENGRPVFSYTFADGSNFRAVAKDPLTTGKHKLSVDVVPEGAGMGKPATATLKVDGAPVGTVRVEKTIPFRFSTEETLDFGQDTGTPVDLSYDVPARFTGKLGKIVMELK
ncbi:MAG: arylsulfatase [Phenylobacterium sp.]|jgi:arylsulfatase A-like enzyme|nr:arylsulfatase [Phenylobacterium sp.]MCA3710189.1 arylsulfatase [Phenylobacterium sp.]MCA3711834.1 arylsulfatase [Phenylobacterium sp.]MCA3722404.1 arylsulfatase [Phenylobacterium sp.]MCA3730443.1 arylsulfatase [Phenylobacterium sp.]MCA3738531.1 arylsulfatase [Phenylobacterium sp.]